MDDDPDLRHLLDAEPTTASPDDLRAIVARAGRRTARIGAAAAVAVMLAGGLGGYLLADQGSTGTRVVQTAAQAPAAQAHAAQGAIAAPPGTIDVPTPVGVGPFSHDLTRTTRGGVTVRVFHTAGASAASQRYVEVSTDAMIGSTSSALGDGTAEPSSDVLGTDTGAPVIVVTAWTSATVTEVRWTGEGGGDAMAPSDHFVALAEPVTSAPATGAAIGTLTYTDAAGHAVDTVNLHLGLPITIPDCEYSPGFSAAAPASSQAANTSSNCENGGSSGGAGTSTCSAGSPASETGQTCEVLPPIRGTNGVSCSGTGGDGYACPLTPSNPADGK